MIPISVPHIGGNEWKYIKECLDTEWVSSVGTYVDRFEEDICRSTGARYAVACVNGTAALHVALRLAGVEPGDEVIVPTVTFIAPVNAVRYLGADPVFMDCDDFYNIDAAKVIEFVEKETVFRGDCSHNKVTKKRIRAIVPVHVFGNAVCMDELVRICAERNIKIVEDATESLGTHYVAGGLTGAYTGTIGDIGCFSFNGNKIITTGGGGMIVTNNAAYAEKARYLTTQAKDDGVRYIHNEIGYNYRLTNVLAAMGVAQLERLPAFIDTKRKNYEIYRERVAQIPGLQIAATPDYAFSNCWYYCLRIDREGYGTDRDGVMSNLEDRGIQSRPLWHPNHLQEPYRRCQAYRIEVVFRLLEETLNIPCSVNITAGQIEEVIAALRSGRRGH